MSIYTVAGRKKLEDDEMQNYILQEKQKLEGIQANIELQKKKGNYDASIILQVQLNDMMGISNSNIDTSQAERDIGNLLKKNIETSLNTNKKIGGIEDLKKEIENDKVVEKKKKLANITSNLKKLGTQQSIKAFGNKFKGVKAQEAQDVAEQEAGRQSLHARFMAEELFKMQLFNKINKKVEQLKNHEINGEYILPINNDLEQVLSRIEIYRGLVIGEQNKAEKKRVKAKLEVVAKRFNLLKGRLETQKRKPEYAVYFDGGGAGEEKAPEDPFAGLADPFALPPDAPAPPAPPARRRGRPRRVVVEGVEIQPPPPPPPPHEDDAPLPLFEGHGLPRMYSLLRKKSTKKGRGIAMQEVLSNFHHKALYFNTKVKKARQIILKDEKEKLDNLINKYDILTGEILAGNNNKELLRQLKSLITRLVNLKKIDSDVANEALQQLQLIK